MKSNVQITKASREDVPGVLELIRELAIYENAADEVELTSAQLLEDAFGENPIVEILVAHTESVLAGAALFYEKYSTWKGRGMHLEDLIVSEKYRRRGIGSLLFRELIEIAQQRGYSRMDWQVLDWNRPAIKFYENYQAEITSEWLNCRFTASQLQSKNK